jgi:N6-adenosine-specific RNA methylase IME4
VKGEIVRLPGGELRRLGLKGQLSLTGWDLPDDMSEGEWLRAGMVLARIDRGIGWWIGDWWAFGEKKYGRRRALTEAEDWAGPAFQTCANCASVARKFETSCRQEVLTFEHHRLVAGLERPDADRLLDWCKEPLQAGEPLPRSTHELRTAVIRWRITNHRRRIGEQLFLPAFLPPQKFNTIIIDPPWPAEMIEREVRPNQIGLEYPIMTEDELAAFDVAKLAAEDCHLFCWATQRFLPLCLELIAGWGFRYVLTMVWHKPGGFQPVGLPQYNCEFVVYARCGSPRFVDTKAFNCCFEAPRREHSRKPDEFYDLVRRVTAGPRIDVFSREPRPGFDQYGNELTKFAVGA